MGPSVQRISRRTARRLAVSKQHLAGKPVRGLAGKSILTVVKDLAYVQMDTFSTVVPPQVIALWSRVDDLRLRDLEHLLWKERTLFETCPDPTSLAPTEDYVLHLSLMKHEPAPSARYWSGRRGQAREWVAQHEELHDSILRQLDGCSLTLDQFEGHVPGGKREDGWTTGSDLALTLAYLHTMGEVIVVGRQGNLKVWGLPGDFLPGWVKREGLPRPEVEAATAERAIRAMGTASRGEINYYFPRGKYDGLRGTLANLQASERILPVQVEGFEGKEARYIHADDLPRLNDLEDGAWEPRLSLLSPYDNLISGGERTKRLFDFEYTHGNYLPKAKRKYGVYVIPILWGDQIVGRMDPSLDRKSGRLTIHSVHAEPQAPKEKEIGRLVSKTVERFADFVGADEVVYTSNVPPQWRATLR